MNNHIKFTDPSKVTPDIVKANEKACKGGCLAAVRQGFEIPSYFDDRIHEIPNLSEEDKNKDYILFLQKNTPPQ
ncbi:hypothetical protein SH2C18_47390 [Clostridium sediminicola]|uniref:hypothetical protein n=1 Tax=Clostridium sediminicola TaxID=3114879 RepID=UPI0031F20F3E